MAVRGCGYDAARDGESCGPDEASKCKGLFCFWRWKGVLECNRTDLSGPTRSVCVMGRWIGEEQLAAVGTVLQDVMRSVERTKLVSVSFCYSRSKAMLRYGRTDWSERSCSVCAVRK